MENEKVTWADRFDRAFEKQKKEEARLIFSIFFFNCTCILCSGFIIGCFFARSIESKFIIAGIFFCIFRYLSRNKLSGRVVYGGMEKPWTISFGATLCILSAMFASQKNEYALFSLLLLLPGIYFFHSGHKAGPHYGWGHYFRCLREEN